VMRYGLQGLVQDLTGTQFPAGTLAVNLAGCFLLGDLGQ
jgi:fluoride ion exporter CrcB/FEX